MTDIFLRLLNVSITAVYMVVADGVIGAIYIPGNGRKGNMQRRDIMKRLVAAALLLCLLVGLVSTGVSAVDLPTSGKCGQNATWQIDLDTNTLLISGTGPMEYETAAPWYDYTMYNDTYTKIQHIIVGEGITSIKECAFSHLTMVKTAYIADTVETIGERAFFCCWRMEKVYIGNRVSTIETEAFNSCFELDKVALPANVKHIHTQALSDSKMTAIIIPDGVTTIQNNVLRATNLTSVTIPASVAIIGGGAFYNSRELQDVYFTGTQAQWEAIVIDESEGFNDHLLDATMHYNHVCTWDGGVTTWEATCQSKSVKTYTCTVCGGTRDESGSVGSHAWGSETVLTQPSCTATGTKKQICTTCHTERNVEISATGHQWDAGVKNADTTVTYTCSVCTEKKTEGTPVLTPPTQATEEGILQTEATQAAQPTEATQAAQPTEETQQTHPTQPQQAEPAPVKSFPWLVVIGVMVVLAGSAGVLLWLKKKKQ